MLWPAKKQGWSGRVSNSREIHIYMVTKTYHTITHKGLISNWATLCSPFALGCAQLPKVVITFLKLYQYNAILWICSTPLQQCIHPFSPEVFCRFMRQPLVEPLVTIHIHQSTPNHWKYQVRFTQWYCPRVAVKCVLELE